MSKPNKTSSPAPPDPWERLRRFTPARIALGRAGVGLPTAALLRFQMDHALARDAVHLPLNQQALFEGLKGLGLEVVSLRSRAADRREYLLRPDLGRRLDPESAALWAEAAGWGAGPYDLALVVSDGLSAAAIQRQTIPFLRAFLPLAVGRGLRLAPAAFVALGRVAVGDEVGEICGARAAAILIGERPGLSAPDSMGVYLTHGPRIGLTDESRNCVSNIRPEGQPPEEAARALDHLLAKALALGYSGVRLKDDRTLGEAPGERSVVMAEEKRLA